MINIVEISLIIDGVWVVIDVGLVWVLCFDLGSGMICLEI